MSEHFILAPSGAHRWMHCAGSLLFDYTVKDEDREEAKEGTLAHELAATYLNSEKTDTLEKEATDAEMVTHVLSYVEYCENLIFNGSVFYIERKFDLSEVYGLTPLQKGTLVSLGLSADPSGIADFVSFDMDTGILNVVDLKYGKGVEVFAKGNEQGGIYCCGAVNEIIETFGIDPEEIKLIRFTIFQPRIKKKPDVWEISIEELSEFKSEVWITVIYAMEVLSKILQARQSPNTVDFQEELKDFFHPSDESCSFCKGKGRCRAQEKYMENALAVSITGGVTEVENAFHNVGNLSNEELSIRLPVLDMMAKYIKALWSEAHGRMMNGNRVPGFKLTAGKKGNRYWIDEVKSEAELKRMKFKIEEMYDLKLKSPAKIQKECERKRSKIKWKKLQDFIDQKEASLTIVPEDDPRPDMTPEEVNFDNVQVIEEPVNDERASNPEIVKGIDEIFNQVQIETEETAKETGEKSLEEQMNELLNN